MTGTRTTSCLSPEEALQRLIDGNRRFLEAGGSPLGKSWDPRLATTSQRPFAVVLGCSDSRVPVEILFDQGFGDLFVVRIAGNVVTPSIVGTIEFAVSQFGSPLVVVMGHSGCGAVKASIQVVETGQEPESKNIRSITDQIVPHIQQLVPSDSREGLAKIAVRTNVQAAADHLRRNSEVIAEQVRAGAVSVVEAQYDMETGAVLFFDEAPKNSSVRSA